MAAPVTMQSRRFLRQFLSVCRFRYQLRGLKRNPKATFSKEDEVKLLKRKKISQDPRRNPYVPFESTDPVQKNLVELNKQKPMTVANKKQLKSTKMTTKGKGNSQMVRDKGSPSEGLKPELGMINGMAYTKLRDADREFGQAVIRTRVRKERAKSKEIMLEGRHLILFALKAGVKMKQLYFSGSEVMQDFPLEEISGIPLYKVTYRQMKLWTDVDTPQGLVGIFEMPSENKRFSRDCLPVTVIFDQIRDPGNFGTLLRTAAAIGCKQVIAVKGCVDVWSSKVLRSAAGANFLIPVKSDIAWSDVTAHIPEHAHVYIADSRKPSKETVEELAGTLDIIEELDDLESKEGFESESDGSDSDSDSEDLSDSDEDSDNIKENKQHSDEKPSLERYGKAPLNVYSYEEVDFVKDHTVIVIGGEEGRISVQARKLAFSYYGVCVTVPMMSNIECLNCSVSGSIVMYEANKQFRQGQVAAQNDSNKEDDTDKIDRIANSQVNNI